MPCLMLVSMAVLRSGDNSIMSVKYNCAKVCEVVCSTQPCGYVIKYFNRSSKFIGGIVESSKTPLFVPDKPSGLNVSLADLPASTQKSLIVVWYGLGLRTSSSIS